MRIHPMRLLVDALNKEYRNTSNNPNPWEYCHDHRTIVRYEEPQWPCLPLSKWEKILGCRDYSHLQFSEEIAKISNNCVIIKDDKYAKMIEDTLKKLNIKYIVELC